MSHHPRRIVAVVATLTALISIPATASASSSDAVVSANVSVKLHVAKADKALTRLERAVDAGKTSAIARELKRTRSSTAAAARGARRLAASDSASADLVVAAQALTLAGTQSNELLATLTALVDETIGRAQTLIAGAIIPTIASSQQISIQLTGMLGDVPVDIQPMLASIITALAIADVTAVVNLDAALASGDLTASASAIVAQALPIATDAATTLIALAQSVVPIISSVAQSALSPILGTVASTVGTLTPTALNTATGLIGSVLGSLPAVGGAAGGAGALSGLLGGLLNMNAIIAVEAGS